MSCMKLGARAGKVAQSGGEQVLGCLMGGAAGYLTFVIGSLFWSRVSVGVRLAGSCPCHPSRLAGCIACAQMCKTRTWRDVQQRCVMLGQGMCKQQLTAGSVQIVLSIGAATVCSSSILIGRSLHAENSAKLMAITYLLVSPSVVCTG